MKNNEKAKARRKVEPVSGESVSSTDASDDQPKRKNRDELSASAFAKRQQYEDSSAAAIAAAEGKIVDYTRFSRSLSRGI